MPELTIPTPTVDKKVVQRVSQKDSARFYRRRRHGDWDDNYQLYRNEVKINRLTQRQDVNIPLMKETVKTLLSKIDAPPTVNWKDMGGDESKEMIFQEMWNADYDRLNMEAVDIQDKKTVMLYGRAFKKLDWGEDGLEIKALDIYDVLVDPQVDPVDIETARFIIHENIFKPLSEVLDDDRYTVSGRNKLKIYMNSEDGVIMQDRARDEYERKTRRLREINDGEAGFDFLTDISAGEVIVNLTEHISKEWNEAKDKWEKRVSVYVNDSVELMDEPLMDLLGVDFYPYVTWGDDVETNDFWSDGPADLVRVPNSVINVWFSQLVENRTLTNFQMHWFDATSENYEPQTYQPGAGRMLPAPGNPKDTIMPVQINGLDETMTSIDFIIRLVERGTAATSIDKGVSEKKQITLGEVETLVGKSMERTVSMAKFYDRSWYELAVKYYALVTANETGMRNLYKRSKDGALWPREVSPKDWKSEEGYIPEVKSNSLREEEEAQEIQKLMFVRSQFPNNPALNQIAQSRSLEMLDLTPEELRMIKADQERADKVADQNRQVAAQQGEGEEPQAQTVNQSLNELSSLQNVR